MKICKRPDCDHPVRGSQEKEFCSDRCARIMQKRRARARKRGVVLEDATTKEPELIALTQVKCGRYDCEEFFTPKNINHKYHSPACGDMAAKQKKFLQTLDNLDEIDPAEIKAKESFLVRELERQREILMRTNLKLQSRESAVLSRLEEWLEEPRNIRFEFVPLKKGLTSGNGRETEAHLLFSDPQAGKWENGIGLKVLLDDYIPKVINAVMSIVEKQRYEGPVDHLYIHLLGDLIEGCIIYAGQRMYLDRYNNGDSTVDQCLTMVDALGSLLQTLRPFFKNITVLSAWGNHGRTTKKDDPSLGHDNYDRLIAKFLERICANMDINFIVPEEDRYMVNSMGWIIGGIHGHQLNGKSSLNAMEPVVLRWEAIQHFEVPLDILVMGHRHHAASLDIQGIEVIQNAAMDGGSNWLKDTQGKASSPSQEFFFISKHYGIDSRHRIYLGDRIPRSRAIRDRVLAAYA